MIHLHQLPKVVGREYSCSPFCIKMELYLKAMDISYQNHFSLELNKSPTGKMPYIETEGKKIADSNFIIKYLEQKNNISIDNHLNNCQKATSLAFIRLCEDSLYWSVVYSRWIDNNSSWKKNFSDLSKLPNVMKNIAYAVVKKNVSRQIKAQGLNSLSKSEIYQKAENDIKAIADFLDGRDSFFCGKVSLVDITVFSFLVILYDGSCGNKLQNLTKNTKIEPFIKNMSKLFDLNI